MGTSQSIEKAEKILRALRQLNFGHLAQSEPKQVAALQSVLEELGIQIEDLNEEQNQPSTKQQTMVRRGALLKALKEEGFDQRIGRVYDSDSQGRSLLFKSVPHQRGLLPFDFVLAADYSPSAGLHGIFVGEDRVFSALLIPPAEKRDWQILKQRRFESEAQMREWVTLLSAGFDLPED